MTMLPILFKKTSDNGYIIVGDTSPFGNKDIFLLKISANGTVEWSKTYGSSTAIERAFAVKQTKDNGYIVAGYRYDETTSKVLLLKVNSNGTLSWAKTYQTSASTGYGYGFAVDQTADGGYIIGSLKNDMWLLKVDQNGNIKWQKTYKDLAHYAFIDEHDFAFHPLLVEENGYVLFGHDSSGYAWIMKLNSNGEINDPSCTIFGSENVTVSDVTLSEGDFVTSGSSGTEATITSNSTNATVQDPGFSESQVCYSSGIESWLKTYDLSPWDEAYDVEKTSDGGYVVAGSVEGGFFLMKVSDMPQNLDHLEC